MRSSQLLACSDSAPGRDVHTPKFLLVKLFAFPGGCVAGQKRVFPARTWGHLRAGKWSGSDPRQRQGEEARRVKRPSASAVVEQMQPEPTLRVPRRTRMPGTGTWPGRGWGAGTGRPVGGWLAAVAQDKAVRRRRRGCRYEHQPRAGVPTLSRREERAQITWTAPSSEAGPVCA